MRMGQRASYQFGIIGLLCLTASPVFAGQTFNPHTNRPDKCMTVEEEDGSPSMVSCQRLEVTNNTLTDDGDGAFSLSTGGGGGNSFETIAVPAGASVVADSSTDTLTITETSFLTITGTAATDTIDITQVTTDLGTDGLIVANAVPLTTDTTGNYVAGVADGTGIDGTAAAEGATYTPTFDATELEALTWGAGGNASNIWTFNLSGTDPVMTFSSGTVGVTDGVLTVTDTVTDGNLTTLTTTNTATYSVSGSRTIRGATLSTTSSGAANNTGLQTGLLGDNEVTGTGTLTSNFGVDVTNSATAGTTGTISANTGLRITHEGFPDDGSTVTTSTGIDLIASTTTSDFTNAYVLKIAIDSDPGSTGTSRYAIYFADGTEALGADATNEYGLFQVGTAMNKLSNLSIGNGATSAGVLTLLEDTDAGSNFASFQVPALAANTVYTLPANDGDASQFLQTDGSGALTWATASGSGDITSVGDVISGAAFDGTQGTTLTFNDASGDQTLLYNSGGDLDFNFSDDLNLRDATPHLQWIDTTASQDDFESYADGSQWYLTNVTDLVELLRVDATNSFFTQRNWTWQEMSTTTWSKATTLTLTGIPITFDDADGDQTLSYDAADNDFVFSDDVDVEDATPHFRLTDTTGASDDFEWTADGSIAWFANVTDGNHYIAIDAGHNLNFPQLTTSGGLKVSGPQGKVESSPGILDKSYVTACFGSISTTMNCEEARVYVADACIPTRVQLAVTTAPTGQAIIVDINECSDPATCDTLFSAVSRPQIAASANSGNTTTFTDNVIASGSYIGVDIDQVGSTVLGSNLTITLVCQVI